MVSSADHVRGCLLDSGFVPGFERRFATFWQPETWPCRTWRGWRLLLETAPVTRSAHASNRRGVGRLHQRPTLPRFGVAPSGMAPAAPHFKTCDVTPALSAGAYDSPANVRRQSRPPATDRLHAHADPKERS